MVSQLLVRKLLIINQHLLAMLASKMKDIFFLYFLNSNLSFLNFEDL